MVAYELIWKNANGNFSIDKSDNIKSMQLSVYLYWSEA